MTHRPSRFGWVTTQNNAFLIDVAWTDTDSGAPIDLTDFVITSQLRFDEETEASVDWVVDILEPPTAGIFQMYLSEETLTAMDVGTWWFDIRAVDAGGIPTTHAKNSYLRVDQPITGH